MRTEFINKVKPPCYVISIPDIEENLRSIKRIKEETGCKMLLLQRDFSMFSLYPLVVGLFDGAMSGSLNEAKLGKDEMRKENHIFAPAYADEEFYQITEVADHIIFNTPNQLNKYLRLAKEKSRDVGIRINIDKDANCSTNSRLGVKNIQEGLFNKVSGIYFENIQGIYFDFECYKNTKELAVILKLFEEKYGSFIGKLKWVDFGSIDTNPKEEGEIELLIDLIKNFKAKYGIQVYIEEGESIGKDATCLVAEVLDIVNNGKNIAILSSSAMCHMPDVLELNYTPAVYGAGKEGEKEFSYILAGNTSIEIDTMGSYSFDLPLKVKDKIVFMDIPIDTMVKNTPFNGINLPSIYTFDKKGDVSRIREFSYRDYKTKLS